MSKEKGINVVVVGAGAVGVEMLRVLKRRKFPVRALRVFARRARDIIVDGTTYHVENISPEGFEDMDIALFAGTEGEKGASVTYASEAVKRNCVVIDNGADFRMREDVPLVVPEVNPQDLEKHKGIIANPNCSTIQMVVALYPIYREFGIRRILVTTYQASSGAGRSAQEQLWKETEEVVLRIKKEDTRLSVPEFLEEIKVKDGKKVMPHQLAFNCFPHIGSFGEYDYSSEEWKMVRETHKIFSDNSIHISATCVRIPVFRGHAEAVYIETQKAVDPQQIKMLLQESPGIEVVDNPQQNIYPLPIDSASREEVFVGRIRKDPFSSYGLWLWIVSDNLWKGASLNAVQIAELILQKNLFLR